jgi:hypothetical protein
MCLLFTRCGCEYCWDVISTQACAGDQCLPRS